MFKRKVAADAYRTDPLGTLAERWPPMTNLFESTERVLWSNVYLVMRAEDDSVPIMLFPAFEKAAATTAVTLAIGFTTGHSRLHAFGVVMWSHAGVLHVAVYDPLFSVRGGKEKGGDTVRDMEAAVRAWSESSSFGCAVHHVGRMCMATPDETDDSRVHCVQHIINADYCSIFSIHWLHLVAKRLEGAPPSDDLLKDATAEAGGEVTSKSEPEVLAGVQLRMSSLAANILAAFVEDNQEADDIKPYIEEYSMRAEVDNTYEAVKAVTEACIAETGINILCLPLNKPAQ